jgi:hypothetical protein
MDWPWFDDLVRLAAEIFHITLNTTDSEIGCAPWDRTLAAGLSEFRTWLDANPNELIFIHWDDQGYTLNLTTEVESIIGETLGPLIFTPLDKQMWFPDRWPTPNELSAKGKSVVIQAQDPYGAYSGEWIFHPFLQPGWPINCVNAFNLYPTCGNGSAPGNWSQFGSES